MRIIATFCFACIVRLRVQASCFVVKPFNFLFISFSLKTMDFHDNIVHHPLGAGSYYFKESLIRYLSGQCPRQDIAIHLGSQPNCSPHIGNVTTFAVGFGLAAALKNVCSRTVRVKFVYVDSAPAPGQEFVVSGVKYQKSLSHTGDFRIHQKAFGNVLDQLSRLSGVPYDKHTQDLWREHPKFPRVLRDLISQHQTLGPHLSPDTGKLAIRTPCPHQGCGIADKHGLNNKYHIDGRITFLCPDHGEHYVDLDSPTGLARLEFNTPLRNLIRTMITGSDMSRSWIMCTGSDYAGFYQEQFTWRLLPCPQQAPVIFYAPQILDWSGAKLSKSLYVKQDAYRYLRAAERQYLLNVDLLLKREHGLEALYLEVQEWIEKPFMLFRSYTIAYLDKQLVSRGMDPYN
ncbi:hypothetical protein PMG11_10420 [Penicillium brasilianum]|uniref:Rieske domain-containing protein n=1 Tax=Penicillium brasilianum TaxID=104259 RepID=A0A0F7U2I2_PENBI|nr:hypothetical protein PMG11_10420 [Penicillium brasilianum]